MSQIRIGEKLGSFRLDSIVGSGAMGVVYRGTNESSGKAAAIKVVSGEISQRGKVYERFMREAEILKQFRHPNIVRFLAVGRFQGTSYIAMEFIQGETLDKIVERRETLPWREVVDLGIQICEALHYAHEHGVVHRDLKPSNLMVNDQGRIKLTDFGIAKDLDATALTATGRTLGTAAYMAPEQIRGAPAVSHKTDLYALGIVLYQLLVGKPPFEGSSPMILMHNHLNEAPPRPSAKVEDIPVVLDDLVVALMAKEPSERPWDAAAVAHTLTELKRRVEEGKSVKMVWSRDGNAPLNPVRLGAVPSSRGPSTDPTPRSRDAAGKSTRNRGTGPNENASSLTSRFRISRHDGEPGLLSRGTLETLGLILALVAMGGFMVYWAWPPGAEYLYQHAKPLMESTKRHDWLTALDEYIEPLDKRFPNHPHREETAAWRDKIKLDEAESRSRIITSPVKTALNETANNAERQYVITHAVAAEATKRHDDLEALNQWQTLAATLNPDDPEERPWQLLARKRAADLEHKMKDRRELVLRQLELVEKAFRMGRPVEATTLRAKLVEDFGDWTDLADLFGPMPDREPPAETPKKPLSPNAARDVQEKAKIPETSDGQAAVKKGATPSDRSEPGSPK
jgi:serine/threonine-protein kinase